MYGLCCSPAHPSLSLPSPGAAGDGYWKVGFGEQTREETAVGCEETA